MNRDKQHGTRRCFKASLRRLGTSSANFEVDLRAWELALRRYEEAASVTVPDQIKCAIVAQHAPKAIKRFLNMIPSDVVYKLQ
eukprot:5009729-Heterocapsa_arctica.AAC.1